jgi:DNA-binding NarL/FixJ family response regulator
MLLVSRVIIWFLGPIFADWSDAPGMRHNIFTDRYIALQKFTRRGCPTAHCIACGAGAEAGGGVDSFDRFVDGAAVCHSQVPVNRCASPVRRHLAIVDPGRLRRDCLKLALGLQPRRWHVTDVAAAAELARLMAQGDRFTVILLGGPTCSQINLRELEILLAAAPGTPILVAADCDDRNRALAILRAGARGFLPTNLSLKVLLAALERVRVGGTYMPLALTEPTASKIAREIRTAPWCELTRRQREVLALVSEGLSNKRIAAALTMTESTVKAHVKQIIRRLNVANRTQAALLAARAGSAQSAPSRAIVTA